MHVLPVAQTKSIKEQRVPSWYWLTDCGLARLMGSSCLTTVTFNPNDDSFYSDRSPIFHEIYSLRTLIKSDCCSIVISKLCEDAGSRSTIIPNKVCVMWSSSNNNIVNTDLLEVILNGYLVRYLEITFDRTFSNIKADEAVLTPRWPYTAKDNTRIDGSINNGNTNGWRKDC